MYLFEGMLENKNVMFPNSFWNYRSGLTTNSIINAIIISAKDNQDNAAKVTTLQSE